LYVLNFRIVAISIFPSGNSCLGRRDRSVFAEAQIPTC
jgi:hypothetical protein